MNTLILLGPFVSYELMFVNTDPSNVSLKKSYFRMHSPSSTCTWPSPSWSLASSSGNGSSKLPEEERRVASATCLEKKVLKKKLSDAKRRTERRKENVFLEKREIFQSQKIFLWLFQTKWLGN
jgi:hypothetical protein